MGGGVGEGGGSGEGGGVGDSLLEQLLSFRGTMQAEQRFRPVVEQGGVGWSSGVREQGSVKRVGLVGVAGFDVDARQQASDVAIRGMSAAQLLQQWGGLGGLGGVA